MSTKNLTSARKFAMLQAKAGSSSIKLSTLGKINLQLAKNPKRVSVCDEAASSLGYKYAVLSNTDQCIGYYISYQSAVSAAKKHKGRIVHLHGGAGRKMSEVQAQQTTGTIKFRLRQNPFKPSELKHTPITVEEKVRESFAPGVRVRPYVAGSELETGGRKPVLNSDGTTKLNYYGDIEYEPGNELINTTWPSPDEITIPAPPGFTYLPFQRSGIVAMSRRKNSLLADQQGLGKTIQIAGFINLNEIKKVVIICPGNAVFNWENELYKWIVDKSMRIACYNKGNYTKRVKFTPGNEKRADLDKTNPDFDIVIFPYSNFASSNLSEPIRRVIKLKKPELLIIDEVHVLKNVKSKRSMAIFGGEMDPETGIKPMGIIELFPRKIFLTGTPLVNEKIHELFHFVKALDPKSFGSRSIFEDHFFPVRGRGAKESDRYGKNLDILAIKLRERLMIRRLRRDVLDLPPVSLLPILLPDTPQIAAARRLEEQKIKEWAESQNIDTDQINLEEWFGGAVIDDVDLDRLESENEEEDESGEFNAVIRHVRLTAKDREVFNDIKDEITNLQDILDNPDLSDDAKRSFKAKDEAAKDAKFTQIGSGRQKIPFSFISEALSAMGHAKALSFKYSLFTIKSSLGNSIKNGKFVVFFWTHKTKDILIDQILQSGYTKNQIVILSGGMSNEEKQESVELFQNDINVKFFLGQIEAAGTSITLHSANVSIFVEFDWRPGIVQQAMDRTVRIGQTAENIYEFFLVAEKSIDANVFSVIQKKTGVQRIIFDTVPTTISVNRYEDAFKVDDEFDGKWQTDQREMIQELAEKLNKNPPADAEYSESSQIRRFCSSCNDWAYRLWSNAENKYKQLGAKHKDFPEYKIDDILPVLWKYRGKAKLIKGGTALVNQIEWPQHVTGIEPGVFRPVKTLDKAYSFFAYLDGITRDAVIELKKEIAAVADKEKLAELVAAASSMDVSDTSNNTDEDDDKDYDL